MTDPLPAEDAFPSLLRHVSERDRLAAAENVRWLINFLLRVAGRIERERMAGTVDRPGVQAHPEEEV